MKLSPEDAGDWDNCNIKLVYILVPRGLRNNFLLARITFRLPTNQFNFKKKISRAKRSLDILCDKVDANLLHMLSKVFWTLVRICV